MTTPTPGALILVVEDEAPLRRFLRASLGANGYRLLEAECGGSGPSSGGSIASRAWIASKR